MIMKTNYRLMKWLLVFTLIIQFIACENEKNTEMKAPRAKKITKEFTEFGNTRTDDYYWLRERESGEVTSYLEEENAYTEAVMKPTEGLQEKIYEEIVGRIKQTDMSVPYELNGYQYYTRYEEGKEYPVYCRKKLEEDAAEEVMLDGNKMAEGYAYFQIGGWEVSTNNEMLVYSVDTVSRRKYTLYFKNLKTGEVMRESIPNTSGNVTWANDNATVFYAMRDETLRPFKIFKHKLGQTAADDQVMYHEEDPTFTCYVYKTKSDKYLVIASGSTLSDEYRVMDAGKPDGEFEVFQERERELEYSISHQGNRWLIRTNMDAKNFRLMETAENKTEKQHWQEIIPNRDNVLLEGVDVFKDYYVLSERENGLVRFRVFNLRDKSEHFVAFQEEDYYAYTGSNPEYASKLLRYSFTSLKTPTTVYDYNMVSKESTMKKQYEVLGGYNPDDYVTERIYATARDGVKVPVSVVYKKGFKKDGSQPLLLYGYGSYGYSVESSFRSYRLSLLDRGFAYAIAHIRGGEELGRQWYEDGKLLKKKNTFYDFIDCGKYLIGQKYTSGEKLFGLGGSAGGLLIGAVINIEPDLFKGVIAAVPFVDVITTMLDESIPLTTGEYDEWGNPNEEKYYNYMLSYSPYDQVETKDYPHMLVTTGLHDSQVQYWEPAKWVAKLREMKTDDNQLLLWTNMDFGHSGASGRFEIYKEVALEYAFLFQLADI
jgi:oligopeptidase B